jgi:hypothetical protein
VRRAGIGGALVAPFHRAEGVEGLHDRDVAGATGGDRRKPAHPEVGVGDVRPPLGTPVRRHPRGEAAHVGQQLVLRHRCGRPGGDVHDVDPLAERHQFGQLGMVAAGVDPHLVAVGGECRGQLGDVCVLAAGVDATQGGERAGVFGDHRDPHVSSSRSRSQSARNRSRP